MERKNPFVPVDPQGLPSSGPSPLEVALLRGASVESRHRVHAMVVDSSGQTLHEWGNAELTFFPRSSVKLLQAVTWVAPGLQKGFPIGVPELAIACGSHTGEPKHVEIVRRWLNNLRLDEKNLECGTHDPVNRAAARALAKAGESSCPVHNNCSGKHCGLLTACVARGWTVEGYSSFDHPLQAEIRATMGKFLGMDLSQTPWGIDGCGIPTYSTPLRALALAMAQIADGGKNLGSEIQEAVRLLSQAVAARPELIGGTGDFSTQVVAETEGRVFAKVGAEGVFGAWIPREGLGVALKCEDGTVRAAEAALAAVLRELGHPLSFYSPLVTRWSGEVVGQFICG